MAGQGQIYTFSDAVTTKRTISTIINMIDPQDTPCVSYFGLSNQSKFRLENFPNHKYVWLSDTLRTRTTTMNEAGFDSSETDLIVTDSTIFKPGDVIQIEDEKIWIESINYTTHTLTIVRGWGSTSGAAHADGTTVTYLFSARLEGDDSDSAWWTTPTEEYNHSQIMHWEISVSNSELKATQRYGIPDTYKYQLMKALGGLGAGNGSKGRAGDLMIDLEKTFFYGERIARAAGVAGGMGGPDTYITTNTQDLNGATLSEDVLLDQIQNCWSYGGKPNVILCNAFNKRLINSWYAGSIRTERTERTGGVLVNQIETDFGTLDVMLNRWCPANKVYILQKEYMGWVTLRDWEIEELGKTGDGQKWQLTGEFGFVLTNPKAHAIISDTATSA